MQGTVGGNGPKQKLRIANIKKKSELGDPKSKIINSLDISRILSETSYSYD